MRIALAAIVKETNSFSPIPTELGDFKKFGLHEGKEVIQIYKNVGEIGGFFEALKEEKNKYDIIPLISARDVAGGKTRNETVKYLEKRLVSGLMGSLPLDGVFFIMHGAHQSEGIDDLEGYFLSKIRDIIGMDTPLVCTMDHHGNITRTKMDKITALVASQTQPHDIYETGYRAAKILFRILRNVIKPVMVFKKIPMITHQEQFLTSKGPMKEWFDMAREIEKIPGVISVSNFPMQPWLDTAEGGYGTVVTTDNKPGLANELSVRLADKAWSLKDDLWKMDSIPAKDAVLKADRAANGLVVLTDTGDGVFGGSTGDSTTILEQLLISKIRSKTLLPIVDEKVVEEAINIGIGGKIITNIGGKTDTVFQKPVLIEGLVKGIGGGELNAEIVGRKSFNMGKAVIIEIGNINILASQFRGIGGNHPIAYQHFGIDPGQAKIIVLKTSANWQCYDKWISKIIRVDTLGRTMSHLDRFKWNNITRQVWPLDNIADWKA